MESLWQIIVNWPYFNRNDMGDDFREHSYDQWLLYQ